MNPDSGGGTNRSLHNPFSRHGFYTFMSKQPLLFAVFLPIVFIVLMSVGFTRDDYVEDSVGEIWTKTSGDLYEDRQYLKSLEENPKYTGRGGVSVFLAMARARVEGGNLFTNKSLHEIGERMEETEKATVVYKGHTYTWQDICLRNNAGTKTTYKWPCVRLSAMDLFEESKWAFKPEGRLTHYNIVTDNVIGPRVQRMGSLDTCRKLSPACEHAYQLRSSKDYAIAHGKDETYAEPLLLLADLKNWEESHPCKLCIENHYAKVMNSLVRKYGVIFQYLEGYSQLIPYDSAESDDVKRFITNYTSVVEVQAGISRSSVEEFYRYYVERSLYGSLGFKEYFNSYQGFNTFCSLKFGTECLPPIINPEDGVSHLFNHADNDFSSVNIAGLPLPLWNGKPLGGSGLDLSGMMTLDLLNADELVNDPGLHWFVAAVTPMNSTCGNNALPSTSNTTWDAVIAPSTQYWCTEHRVGGVHTKQYFAKMWYDLLVDSEQFLNIVQGKSDPYTWTSGEGCPYDLAKSRYSFSNQPNVSILENSSTRLYSLDEGATIGAVPRNILLGDTEPPVGQYNKTEGHHLKRVGSIQTLYLASVPSKIVDRVKNCNRPNGSIEITEEDAEEVLYQFKNNFEEKWAKDWDKDEGDIQFVGLFDDTGATGSTGRLLKQLTLDGTDLMAISFVLIFVFSATLLTSCDVVQSRVLLTAAGVILVILSFFAALGVVILIGIKFNITIGWTLPFLMVGLGVDSMYIIILALKNLGGNSTYGFIETMKEVVVPITMTSLVNFSMFSIMNLSTIPAVFETAQAAMICIIFLWVAIVLCFPSYCYLDLMRQKAGRTDIIFCRKNRGYDPPDEVKSENIVYKNIYYPMLLKKGYLRIISSLVVLAIAFTLLGIGIWGVTEIHVGLGLEDLFPKDSAVGAWATIRTEDLASWPITMNWGDLDYTDPHVQMRVVKQFEDVVLTNHVTDTDSKFLWIADFATWTTRHCDSNFEKQDSTGQCGHDFVYESEGNCNGTWTLNVNELRTKITDSEECGIGGYCLEGKYIHPDDKNNILNLNESDEYCPVFKGWSEDKLQFCVQKWRTHNDVKGSLLTIKGTATGVTDCSGEYNTDGKVVSPIPISSSPSIFGIDLFSHDDTLDMIRETRRFCDDDKNIRCWMGGIPFDYWEQYLDVFDLLTTLSISTVAVGFGVSTLFLFADIFFVSNHSLSKVIIGSTAGGIFIGSMCALAIVIVIGLSSLLNVNLTAFSVMSFVLSVGFVVEYAVHITHRFLMAPSNLTSALSRVEYAMSFLFVPTFMSFVSSTIGVCCLGFTKFEFNTVFFFRPLLIVMFVTYFCGCYALPLLLSFMNFEFLNLGNDVPVENQMTHVDGEKDIEVAEVVKAEDSEGQNVKL